MPKQSYCYEFPRPAVTVDIVLVTRSRPRRVLLIRRKHKPYAGCWALPGGFVDKDEALETAARRELKEEVGLEVEQLEQLYAFGDPCRDPRGWTISVTYLGVVDARQLKPKADDDAAAAAWHSLARPPRLAFDHACILAAARHRLRNHVRREPG
jgi:8-oxo-dGTP diphosphatase